MKTRAYILLIAPIAILYLIFAVNCVFAYTYETTHFVVYYDDYSLADYAKTVGDNLEYYYGLYTTEGISLAPPCDAKYAVYIRPLERPYQGFTSWIYRYNPSTGEVTYACITNITISTGLKGNEVRFVAAHELTHVAQVAYLRNAKVANGYLNGPPYGTWYWEGLADANAMRHVGCISNNYAYYFRDVMYMKNPYMQGPKSLDVYSYSTFFMWLLEMYDIIRVMKIVFSSSTVINDWLDTMYVSFLKHLVHGIRVCGSYYEPRFVIVDLSEGSSVTYKFDLPGLSAVYIEALLPRPGIVTILVDNPSITSNFILNNAIAVRNTTLRIALINSKTDEVSFTLRMIYRPYLNVKVEHAIYDLSSGMLHVKLKVMTPLGINRLFINGTPYPVNNGLVDLMIKAKFPSIITLIASYEGFEDIVRLRIGPIKPRWIPPYIPIASNSTVSFKIQFENYGDVPVLCPLSAFGVRAYPDKVEVKRGASHVTISLDVFRAINAVNLTVCGFNMTIRTRVVNSSIEFLKADLEHGVVEATIYVNGAPVNTIIRTLKYPSEISLTVNYTYAELRLRLKTPIIKVEAIVERHYVKVPSMALIIVRVQVPKNVELYTRLVIDGIFNKSIHVIGEGVYEYRTSYPVLTPGIYDVSITLKGLFVKNLTIYGLSIRRLVISTPVLVNKGDEADITIYADYRPNVKVPLDIILRGCFNISYENYIRPGKAITLRLKSNRACVLRLIVDLAGLKREAIVIWSYLIVKCSYRNIDMLNGMPLLPHNACFSCIVLLAHNHTPVENPSLRDVKSNLRLIIRSPTLICVNGVGLGYIRAEYTYGNLRGSWELKFVVASKEVEKAYGLIGELPKRASHEAREALFNALLNGNVRLADELARDIMLVTRVYKWDFMGLVIRQFAISRLQNGDLRGFSAYASYLRYTPIASIAIVLAVIIGVIYVLSKSIKRSKT